MPVQITVNDVTGTTPYDLYVCDSGYTSCVYITTFASPPYTFDVPSPLDSLTTICVKIVDNNGCEITDCQNP